MKHGLRSIGMIGWAVLLLALPGHAQYGIFDSTMDWDTRGDFYVPGSVSVEDGVYRLEGNGDDIWDVEDEGFFVYTEKSGSWRLTTRLQMIQDGGSQYAKSGPMIRVDPESAESPHYWTCMHAIDGGSRVDTQWRVVPGEGSSYTSFPDVADQGDGVFLRVTRIAELDYMFTEYSLDGEEWIVSHQQSRDLPETLAYGLAICNHIDNEEVAIFEHFDVSLEPAPAVAKRTFSAISYEPGVPISVTLKVGGSAETLTVRETPPPGWGITEISDGGEVENGTIVWNLDSAKTVTYVVTPPEDAEEAVEFNGETDIMTIMGSNTIGPLESLGIFDNHLDIGSVGVSGSASYMDDMYMISGSGSQIWNNADEFHFLYKEVTGSFRFYANVFTDQFMSTNEQARSGLMVRDSLDPGASHGTFVMNAMLEITPIWREMTDGGSNWSGSWTDDNNGDLEIVRNGNTLSFYYNTYDGERQLFLTHEVELEDPVYVGFAVSSLDNDNLTNGEFFDVGLEVLPLTTSRQLPDVVYNPGQTISDIVVSVDVMEEFSGELVETLPENWTVEAVETTQGDASISGNTLTWDLSGVLGQATMTYSVLVSEDDFNPTAEFSGEVAEGSNALPVAGDTTLEHAPGLSPEWSINEGMGLWLVHDGVVTCYGNGEWIDPKTIWVEDDFGTTYTVRADLRIDTWENHDWSRGGVAAYVQPEDNAEGIRLLLHEDITTIQYLNDATAWSDLFNFDWTVGEWYTMELEVVQDSDTFAYAVGRIRSQGAAEWAVELPPWEADHIVDRAGGFPGLGGSSSGSVDVSFDNFQVIVDGEVVFEDNFEEYVTSVEGWMIYE